jgi:hypothetical protein
MKYWLDLFTPYTWTRFREHGSSISGFRPRQRRTAFDRVSQGDASKALGLGCERQARRTMAALTQLDHEGESHLGSMDRT